MSLPGRPGGDYHGAQHEGSIVSELSAATADPARAAAAAPPSHGDIADALQRLPAALRSHWRLMVLVFLLLGAATVAGAYLKRQHYESAARLLVKLEQRNISLSQADLLTEQAAKSAEEAVATQAEMLSSIDNIVQVVRNLGPEVLEPPPPTSLIGQALRFVVTGIADALDSVLVGAGLVTPLSRADAAVEFIVKNLRITPVRRTQIVEVTFRARTPVAANRVLTELVRLHLAKLARVNATSEGYQFYRRQAEELAVALRQAEDTLGAFKRKHGVIDALAEKTMLMQKIERLSSMLEGSMTSQAATPAPTAGAAAAPDAPALNRGLVAPLGDTRAQLAGNELSQMLARLAELRLERVRRASLFEPGTPLLDEIDNQVRSLERTLDAEIAQLRGLVNAHKARLGLLDGLEAELFQLQRDVLTRQENYRTYVKAAEDRRISEQEQGRSVAIVFDAPSQPARPLPPSRLLVLLIGLALSAVLALASGVVAEALAVRRRG